MAVSLYSNFGSRTLAMNAFVLVAALFAVSAAQASAVEKADLTVVNTTTNVWKSRSSERDGAFSAIQWGIEGDVRVPADYDGDGTKDVAVWRPSNGNWYILCSRGGKFWQVNWGRSTPSPTGDIEDVPVPADFDGDKIDDVAVWRPAEGKWYVLTSKSGHSPRAASIVEWGQYGDIPVPADYDGDGLTDAAVFRSMQNRWYIAQSKTGELDLRTFGIAGTDLLVPADYTGDGRADVAVFRSGVWHVQDHNGRLIDKFEFGFADSIPVPADYDGDGTTDFAVYKHGTWYVHESGTPRLRTLVFGGKREVPVNSLSVKPSIIAIR